MAVAPPNPSQDQAQQVIRLYSEGRFAEASARVEALLQDFPKSSFLYNILGASYAGLRNTEAAIASYTQALKINPEDAKTHFNLGIALNDKGALDEAISSYKQAVTIDPNYAAAYINLGNALKDADDLGQAINSYRQAITIAPDFAEAYCNLGNALKDQGDLEQAISTYTQALQIAPDYVEAYNNKGSALKDKGRMEEAKSSYTQALSIRPDYVDAAWNMVGTAQNIDEAELWLNNCLAIDPSHEYAKLQLCVLKYFRGERVGFDEVMKSSLKDHSILRSMKWVSGFPVLPKLHFNRWSFFDAVIELSEKDRPFYEFGVFTGEAFRYLIMAYNKGYGFDTFEGLPEDWHEEKAGSYSSRGVIPDIAGGEFVAGKFEDTLPAFFSESRPLASLINFDADLYTSTICALNNAKPVIDSNTVLVFDEFIVNETWEQDEYRALIEFCASNNLTFEVLAVSFFTKQVAVKLQGL